MAERLLYVAEHHRPRFGWLALVLLVAVLAGLVFAVVEVEWAPQTSVIVPLALAGFFLSAFLAARPVRAILAWLVITVTGCLLSVLFLARVWPPWFLLDESASLSEFTTSSVVYAQQQLALFADRIAGWLAAVTRGGSSTETLAFVFALALAAWMVAALLAWSAYRWQKPQIGLAVVGVALALNTFYGASGLYWVGLFVGSALTAFTYLDYLYREKAWERDGVDYSSEVRNDLLVYAAGVSLFLMATAMAIPTINVHAIARAFQSQPAIVEAEETLSRAFAGVSVARPSQQETDETRPAAAGQLPRGFLIGDAPELTETVAMTATVRVLNDQAIPPGALDRFHWRSVSFEVYTGRGWQRSTTEREEAVRAGETIAPAAEPPLESSDVITLTQSVDWQLDHRAARYTVGRPLIFSHDINVYWRGVDDLVGVQGRNNPPRRYAAQSQIIYAPSEVLNEATLAEVSPEILARYTVLPDTVPQRVRDLARQIVGLEPASPDQATGRPIVRPEESLTPYQQALAIESFLHQYPYTLDVGLPPPDADMVDYFLFDLQRGFCDYYASAMVVLARSVGLPARLAAGYLPQPPGEDGTQVIRQINAHSWAEIYFPGAGWVEFEPTAPFAPPPSSDPTAAPTQATTPSAVATPPPVAIPERDPQHAIPWAWVAGTAAVLLLGWWMWGRRWWRARQAPRPVLDDIQAAFFDLQANASYLGYSIRSGQTPAEFAAGLLCHLDSQWPGDTNANTPPREGIRRLTGLFIDHQYGPKTTASPLDEARRLRAEINRWFRRAIWRNRLRRHHD